MVTGSIRLEELSHKYDPKLRLDKTVLAVALLEDLPHAVRQVAVQATREQIRMGNNPTNILVDNRGNRPVTEAKFRVQVFFSDREKLYNALVDTWDKVQKLTPVKSGRAIGSYQLWFKRASIGPMPGALSQAKRLISTMNPAKDGFHIVGPVLVYGRKVYWNPKGKQRFRKTVKLRLKTSVFKTVRIRGIMDQVEQSIRRKWKQFAIAEDWVITKSLPKDGRTPAIYVGFKKKGTVANANFTRV